MTDAKTTIKELKGAIKKFQRERNWNPEIRGIAISITIEAAELLEHFQWDDYKKRQDKKEIENELADVIIYCLELALAMDIDVAQAIEGKLKQNREKYPAGLFKKSKATDYYKLYYELKRQHRAKRNKSNLKNQNDKSKSQNI